MPSTSAKISPPSNVGIEPVYPWNRNPLTWLFLFLLPLRILYSLRYRVDSDEPQHLHVVWGWVHGLLPYKDFFENHTPLFHIICAPLLKLFGERPESFLLMRGAMIPFYFLTLWCVYRIATHLFSKREALWAVLVTGLFPPFFFCSVEFRSDDLWMALWLMGLAIWICRVPSLSSRFLAGLMMGAALAASMKTMALLFTFGAGTALLLLTPGKNSIRFPFSLVSIGTFLLGFLIVPGIITLFFFSLGAGHDLYSGTIGFNSMGGLGRWHRTSYWIQWGLFAAILLPSWGVARFIRSQGEESVKATQKAALFLGAMTYFAVLRCFWPLLDREHDLPFYPSLFAVLVPVVLFNWRTLSLTPRWRRVSAAIGVACIVGELARILTTGVLGSDHALPQIRLISQVLQLTNPGETVLDLKGETIFQYRSIWPVYEGITLARLKANLIEDDIPERLLATRTCIATLDNWRFQHRARQFLNANYLPVGAVRVAGQFLRNKTADGYVFRIEIPTRYTFMDKQGKVTGFLDGKPYLDSHSLKAGEHCFQPTSPNSNQIAAVWTRAVERGFSPFDPKEN